MSTVHTGDDICESVSSDGICDPPQHRSYPGGRRTIFAVPVLLLWGWLQAFFPPRRPNLASIGWGAMGTPVQGRALELAVDWIGSSVCSLPWERPSLVAGILVH